MSSAIQDNEEKIENKTVKEKYEPKPGCWDIFYWYFKIHYTEYFDISSLKKLSELSKWHHEESALILATRNCIVYKINPTNKEHMDRFQRMMKLYRSEPIVIILKVDTDMEKKKRKGDRPAFVISLADHINHIILNYNRSEMTLKGFKCIELYQTAHGLYLEVANGACSRNTNIADVTPYLNIKQAGEMIGYWCQNPQDVSFPTPDFMESARHIKTLSGTFDVTRYSQYYKHCEKLCVPDLTTQRPLMEWHQLTSLKLKTQVYRAVLPSEFIVPRSLQKLKVFHSDMVVQMVPSKNYFLDTISMTQLRYSHFSYVVKLARKIVFQNLLDIPRGEEVVHSSNIIRCPSTLDILEYGQPKDNLQLHPFLDFTDTDMSILRIAQCFVFKLPTKCNTLHLHRNTSGDNQRLIMPDNLVTLISNYSFGLEINTLPISVKNIHYEKLYAVPKFHPQACDINFKVGQIKSFSEVDSKLHIFATYFTTFECSIFLLPDFHFLLINFMENLRHLSLVIEDQHFLPTYELKCPQSLQTLSISFKRETMMNLTIVKNANMTDKDITLIDKGLNSVTFSNPA